MTLPKHLTILVRVNAPGIVTVFINGTSVFGCGSYGWVSGAKAVRWRSARNSWPD